MSHDYSVTEKKKKNIYIFKLVQTLMEVLRPAKLDIKNRGPGTTLELRFYGVLKLLNDVTHLR